MRVITSLIPALLLGSLVLAPLVASQAADSVHLSAKHAAAVDRQRRIFFQYDPAADIQRKGGFGADMDAVMSYVFDAACQPGSQLDTICIDVSNEGVAHYRSKTATVTPGALVKNPATQKLTRLEFLVPTENLKRGENQISIAVNRKGPFPPSTFVKVEKVEMHLK
jgi:hypothetical protein